jgi:hypothetical protein
MKISGAELRELQDLTYAMAESFGLDRRIEKYEGKRPISFYRWDFDCLVDVVEEGLREAEDWSPSKYPWRGRRRPAVAPLRSLLERLRAARDEAYRDEPGEYRP